MTTGSETFSQLADTEQLKVLGPAKYAAWKENKFSLSDLVGRKYDPQWGWTGYEKSLTEMIGVEQAKGYTRLALMGVAKNAGNYSVDDLVRIAGIGLRELTPVEVNKIHQTVLSSSFEPNGKQKVSAIIVGQVWNGKLIKTGDILEPGAFHYLKHGVVGNEWPLGTTYDEYIQSLKSVVENESSGMFVSKYNGYWQVGFVGESGIWHGEKGFDHILLEYRVKYGYWVTGFQPEEFEKQLIKDHENITWLRILNSK